MAALSKIPQITVALQLWASITKAASDNGKVIVSRLDQIPESQLKVHRVALLILSSALRTLSKKEKQALRGVVIQYYPGLIESFDDNFGPLLRGVTKGPLHQEVKKWKLFGKLEGLFNLLPKTPYGGIKGLLGQASL